MGESIIIIITIMITTTTSLEESIIVSLIITTTPAWGNLRRVFHLKHSAASVLVYIYKHFVTHFTLCSRETKYTL